MLGDLTAAFGLTVLCLAPILLISLVFPPLLMRFTRPTAPTRSSSKPASNKPVKRGPIGAAVAFARFYFLSLVMLGHADGSVLVDAACCFRPRTRW